MQAEEAMNDLLQTMANKIEEGVYRYEILYAGVHLYLKRNYLKLESNETIRLAGIYK